MDLIHPNFYLFEVQMVPSLSSRSLLILVPECSDLTVLPSDSFLAVLCAKMYQLYIEGCLLHTRNQPFLQETQLSFKKNSNARPQSWH